MRSQGGAARSLAIGVGALLALAALVGSIYLLAGGPGAGGPGARGAGAPAAGAAPGANGGASGPGPGAPPLAKGGEGEAGGDRIPPDVLRAMRGGPLPVPPTGTSAPPGEDWSVRPLEDEGGLLASRGATARETGGAGAGAGGAGAGAGVQELERRAEWVKRQERRNELRVQVMRTELGVPEESAARARTALTEFVTGKVTLYESIEEKGREDPRLRPGLEALREELAQKLRDAIGQKNYEAYAAMDAAGKFVLPEEKKKP